MHFDSRLPRQERPSQKKKERESERERETIEAMLPLCPPFQQGNEKSICIAAHQFAHFNSASFTGRDELGEYYQQADANTSLFLRKTLI